MSEELLGIIAAIMAIAVAFQLMTLSGPARCVQYRARDGIIGNVWRSGLDSNQDEK
jgi:hypothetical protein